MGNYALAIKELEKDIILEEQIHKQKIEDMINHLKYLKENNNTCMKCEGNKFVLRTVNGNGNDLEKVECNVCNGTGKKAMND